MGLHSQKTTSRPPIVLTCLFYTCVYLWCHLTVCGGRMAWSREAHHDISLSSVQFSWFFFLEPPRSDLDLPSNTMWEGQLSGAIVACTKAQPVIFLRRSLARHMKKYYARKGRILVRLVFAFWPRQGRKCSRPFLKKNEDHSSHAWNNVAALDLFGQISCLIHEETLCTKRSCAGKLKFMFLGHGKGESDGGHPLESGWA